MPPFQAPDATSVLIDADPRQVDRATASDADRFRLPGFVAPGVVYRPGRLPREKVVHAGRPRQSPNVAQREAQAGACVVDACQSAAERVIEGDLPDNCATGVVPTLDRHPLVGIPFERAAFAVSVDDFDDVSDRVDGEC